ncbi:hypothetical protein KR093_000099 [Drosophila rubida]|uniref:Choline transporter-like protein n=1 Tax=Drosophila rubida TaxID=30044 RepID=A0AAD4PNA9_9MUSC|nr:hypothetical protein KR093_000099 [Drosophila rubida]
MTENVELMNKYGPRLQYDRNFKGPRQRDRSCTDVPCLIIFLLFLAGWAFIAQYALKNGDLNKLMVPTDMFNQKCGIDSSVLKKKYLFFFNLDKCIDPLVPITGCDTPQVCVESCPSQTFVWDSMKNKDFNELKRLLVCKTDADKAAIYSKSDMQRAIDENRCARYYIKSQPFLNRCMFEFSDQLCELLPDSLFRNRRDTASSMLLPGNWSQELQMQAMALSLQSEAQARVAPQTSAKQAPVDEKVGQCRRQQINSAVIKEKMMQTNTRLAKMVGNLVAHFYNGTHDAQQLGEEIVEDLVNSATVVLTTLILTMIASLIFISVMRWLAGPILWISIFGVLIGLLVAIYYGIKQYTFWKNTAAVPQHALNLQSQLQNLLQDSNNWLYLSIFLCVSFVIILLLVIVLRKRIRIAIALTKEGSKAVSTVISTVFFPIFSWALYILAIAYAIGVGLYLATIGTPSFLMVRRLTESGEVTTEQCVCQGPAINYTVGAACDPNIFQQYCYINQRLESCIQTTCSFNEIDNPPFVQWSIAYNVFGFLWLSFFISAFSEMVLAATFARWYWTFKKRDVPYFTLTTAFCQTAAYHLGTLAFGSLILAICRLIRLVLEYIDSKLKKYDNAVTRAILCCMRCFFWLLETFLRFLNRNAYIMCAIHGKNFCTSAKDAFNLLMRNFLRVVALDKVTDFLFFLSKLLLTGGAGVATYYFLANNPSVIQLNHKAVPTTVVVIAAFLITSVFFGVYSMAVDTLFLCFLEDCERNDGSPEKPYFMSKQLMKILGKKNKLPQRQRRSK